MHGTTGEDVGSDESEDLLTAESRVTACASGRQYLRMGLRKVEGSRDSRVERGKPDDLVSRQRLRRNSIDDGGGG